MSSCGELRNKFAGSQDVAPEGRGCTNSGATFGRTWTGCSVWSQLEELGVERTLLSYT